MSFLQRLSLRTLPSLVPVRKFTTSHTVLSAVESNTNKTATGLYQFLKTEKLYQNKTGLVVLGKPVNFLWYVLLKERNLLATQREEARRLKIHRAVWTNEGRMKKCQKSMARIKFVLNERQRAYEDTLEKQ
ncbi:unnamed protein product [Cunninghamella blakesleeana]